MTMRYLEQPTSRQALGGCYRHAGRNQEGVALAVDDLATGGELYLCAECIRDAAQVLNIGRARRIKRDKAAEKAKKALESV